MRIFGGARVVGRLGEWDVGFIDMQTDEHGVAPSENLGVLRLRRRVSTSSRTWGESSPAGWAKGRHNVVSGADAVVRLFGQDY